MNITLDEIIDELIRGALELDVLPRGEIRRLYLQALDEGMIDPNKEEIIGVALSASLLTRQ